jgi:AcrR family transcriptional regulator
MEAVARIEDFRHGRVPRVVRERQLVELGEELFAERGYAKASMDELARRAGVTKPVIYELFGSKEGLFRACLEGLALRLADAIAEAARGADAAGGPDPESRPGADGPDSESRPSAGGPASASPPAGEPDPEARLRAGGLAFLRFAQENRVAYELLYEGRFSDAAVNVRRRQAALILELMREMAPDDVDPRELEVAAHAVNSAYEGVAHWMWEHPESDVEELADWTVELLLPGLRRFT